MKSKQWIFSRSSKMRIIGIYCYNTTNHDRYTTIASEIADNPYAVAFETKVNDIGHDGGN